MVYSGHSEDEDMNMTPEQILTPLVLEHGLFAIDSDGISDLHEELTYEQVDAVMGLLEEWIEKFQLTHYAKIVWSIEDETRAPGEE